VTFLRTARTIGTDFPKANKGVKFLPFRKDRNLQFSVRYVCDILILIIRYKVYYHTTIIKTFIS